MADYRANLYTFDCDEIMMELLSDGIAHTYSEYFELLLNKIKTALNLNGASIEIIDESAYLQLPDYNGDFSDDNAYFVLVNSNQSTVKMRYYIGETHRYMPCTAYIKPFPDRPSTSYIRNTFITDQHSRVSVSQNQQILRATYYETLPEDTIKLYILYEKPSYLNGYKFAIISNWFTNQIRDYNYLDAITFYYFGKATHYRTGDETTGFAYIEPETHSFSVLKSIDENNYGSLINNVYLDLSKRFTSNEIFITKLNTKGYILDNFYFNGKCYTQTYVAYGGNPLLHEYLFENTNNLSEYEGSVKDGIMIDDDEYYGLVKYYNGDFSLSSTANGRLLFKKSYSGLPFDAYGCLACASNDYIYVLGGGTYNSTVSGIKKRFYVFDGKLWKQKENLPVDVYRDGERASGNGAVIANGVDGTTELFVNRSANLSRYVLNNNVWEEDGRAANINYYPRSVINRKEYIDTDFILLNHGRWCMARKRDMAMINTTITPYGSMGYFLYSDAEDIIYSIQDDILLGYDYTKPSSERKWETIATIPHNVGKCGCAVIYNSEIHILGGGDTISEHKKHYKWNGSSWDEIGGLPEELYCGVAVVFRNEIHILGTLQNGAYTGHWRWNGTEWKTGYIND